ncbi:MAG: hypothetical protein QOG64_2330, partial [Acidimicrobiaceae bacterium]|nr:hypothetical protein [Acidimicrobiaceae bacterium]
GASSARPEDLLPAYDLVFAKAKCALEAMAVGAAVVLCDAQGTGPMVTSGEFDRLRRLNFGARALQCRLDPEAILGEVKRYDPADAAVVSARVRTEAGLDGAVDELVALYREAITAGARLEPDPTGEARALATFLRPVSRRLREADGQAASLWALQVERQQLVADQDRLRRELDQAAADAEQARQEAAADAEQVRQEAAAGLLQAQDREAIQRRRADGAEEAGAAERAHYQQELDEARGIARAHAEEAGALRGELDGLAATFTFRLRDRLLRVPVAGRVLRLLARLLRP